MRQFLVIDLEATCCDERSIPRSRTEIIEIGAVFVDPISFAVTREFQTFVKPLLHPILTPFCTQLTSIRQQDVTNAPSIAEAVPALAKLIGPSKPRFCSWGDYDRNQFQREARRGGFALPFASDHLNIKQAFATAEGHKKRGLGGALARAGLSFEGTAHRGIDDARNIARLLPFALGERPLPTLT